MNDEKEENVASSWSSIAPLVDASFPLVPRLNLLMARLLVPGMRYHAIRRGDRTVAALVTRRGRLFDEVVSVVVPWVRRSNAPSRRFFESLGFRRERVWALPFGFEEILPWGDHYVYRSTESAL